MFKINHIKLDKQLTINMALRMINNDLVQYILMRRTTNIFTGSQALT